MVFMVLASMDMEVMDMDMVPHQPSNTHRTITATISTVMPISTHRNTNQDMATMVMVAMLLQAPTGKDHRYTTSL